MLWDKTLDIYKDRNATRNALKDVCCELNKQPHNTTRFGLIFHTSVSDLEVKRLHSTRKKTVVCISNVHTIKYRMIEIDVFAAKVSVLVFCEYCGFFHSKHSLVLFCLVISLYIMLSLIHI